MKIEINFSKILDFSTAYMIIGINAITLFADIAVQQKIGILMNLFHFIYFVSIVVIGFVVLYNAIILNKKRAFILTSLFAVLLLSIVFFIVHTGYEEIFKHFIISKFLKHGYILLLLVLFEPDYKNVVKYSCMIARITVCIFSLVLFTTDWFSTGYLAVSDNLIMGSMIVFGWAVYKGGIFDYAIGILGMVSMILFGDRAHILCLFCAVFLLGLKKITTSPHSKKFRAVFFGTLIILAILFIFYSDQIMLGLTAFLGNLGVDSRNITFLLEARLSDSSGRGLFYQNIWDAIRKNPLGYGLLGDVILNYENGITHLITGAYAHNGYLQALCEFGVFFGNAFWIWIVVYSIRAFRKINDADAYILYVSLFSSGVCILMFSYSYWISVPFWGFIALIYNEGRKSKLDDSFSRSDRIEREEYRY